MRTILLTGAGGFIGRHVLRAAAASPCGERWIATDLRAPDAWWGQPEGTEFVAGDLADRGFCRELVAGKGITHVVHLAGWLGKGNSDENRDLLLSANLHSTVHLLDALRDGPAPHFLLPSTGLIYGDQPGPFHEDLGILLQDDYAWSKHLAEQTLLAYARNGRARPCIVRPSVIYGPGQRGGMFVPSLLEALREGRRFPMTAGEQKRDLLCVEDLAQALLGLSRAGTAGTFNASSGTGTVLKDVALLAGKLMGRPDLLGFGDIPYREHETWDYALDPSRLRESIGWTPGTTLEEGLKRTIEWEENKP